MSNRPATVTQVEIRRAIKAAKREGLQVVVVKTRDGASITIPLSTAADEPLEAEREIVL